MASIRFIPLLAFFSSFLLFSVASARPPRSCHGLSSFSFPDFSKDLHSLTLLGDAQFARPGLQISGSQPQSVGGLFYSQPIRFRRPFRPPGSVSFSSFFSFSMDAKEGDGLAFVIAPTKDFKGMNGPWLGLSPAQASSTDAPPLAHTVAVEFDTSLNEEVQDPSGNHVGLDIESLVSLATSNVSDGLSLNDGERLFAWIDYRAPVKVVEVRLSRSENEKPENALLSYNVDLSNIWRDEMFVGFSSSTGKAPQKHIIYSWNFLTVDRPKWKHPGGWFGPHGRHGGRPGHPEWHHDFPGRHHPHAGGFPDWQQHPHPEWHGEPHPKWRHHEEEDSWLDGMSDVWGIVLSLLFGATCGTAVGAAFLFVWTLVRRRFMAAEEDGDEAGILYGYQKITTTSEADAKVEANGYQKLPTSETEGKTDAV